MRNWNANPEIKMKTVIPQAPSGFRPLRSSNPTTNTPRHCQPRAPETPHHNHQPQKKLIPLKAIFFNMSLVSNIY